MRVIMRLTILMSGHVVRVLLLLMLLLLGLVLLVLRLVGCRLMIQFYTQSSCCCWCKLQTLGWLTTIIIIGILLKARGHFFRVVIIKMLL
jgi:hypothetical protein